MRQASTRQADGAAQRKLWRLLRSLRRGSTTVRGEGAGTVREQSSELRQLAAACIEVADWMDKMAKKLEPTT